MPTTIHYDAIVVGARAAGAATALGLARRGHRVLVLDRDRRGADTLSTHALQRVAVLLLDDWGLLDRLRRGGTPPVRDVTFHYEGRPSTSIALSEPLYAPRRTVIDPLLADAAVAAGADVRWRTRVEGLLRAPDGRVRGVRAVGHDGTRLDVEAPLTIGADGRTSRIAAAVAAPVTWQGSTAGAYLYTHVRGVPSTGYRWLFGEGVSAGVVPTDDDTVTVFAGTSSTRFAELRRDPAAALASILTRLSPEVAAAVLAGRRVGPIRGFPGLPGRLRRPFGPGWALVGDAGSFKDPISSHGMTDAFKDAALLADAVDAALRDGSPLESPCAGYEARRDRLTLPLLRAVEPVTTYTLPVGRIVEQHLALSEAMKAETAAFRDLLRPTAAASTDATTREPALAAV